jgi:hypothetical protein
VRHAYVVALKVDGGWEGLTGRILLHTDCTDDTDLRTGNGEDEIRVSPCGRDEVVLGWVERTGNSNAKATATATATAMAKTVTGFMRGAAM